MQYAKEHMTECAAFCQRGPAETERMLRFVLATIQQGLETVPTILADFAELGARSPFAFGAKARGIEYAREHAEQLHADAMTALRCDHALLRHFLQVPGLGLVKAGFAAQLFGGRVGCLDTHNLRLYGIPANAVRFNKAAAEKTRERAIVRYAAACRALGGPVNLWARWCEYKADLSPQWFFDGASVSALHVECLHGAYSQLFPGDVADSEPHPERAPKSNAVPF